MIYVGNSGIGTTERAHERANTKKGSFGQFQTQMCTGNIPTWEKIEVGIKNGMSGEVTFDQSAWWLKANLSDFNLNHIPNAQTQKRGRFPRIGYETESYPIRGKRPLLCVWAVPVCEICAC